MKRLGTCHVLVIAAIVLGIAGGVVFAASVGLKKQPPLTATDNGVTLTVSGALKGLGNGDWMITVTAIATPTTTCTEQGGNQAPGQNPGDVPVVGRQIYPPTTRSNGSKPFSVTTDPPTQPTWDQAGCPNSNWTGHIDDLTFTSFTIYVEQPVGSDIIVFQQTFYP